MSQVDGVLKAVRENLARGRADLALTTLKRALERDPASPALNSAMAAVLAHEGQVDRAVYFALRAARAHPGWPEFMKDVGIELASRGGTDLAVKEFERAISKESTHAGLKLGAAAVLRGAGRYVEAARQMEAALELKTDSPQLALIGLDDWIEAGMGPAAAELARRMSLRHPEDLELTGLRAYYANYVPGAREATQLHRALGEMLQKTVVTRTAPYANTREPSRRLRVGLLSPDLRFSAVGFFIEPFFAHRDRASFELFGYSLALKEDAVGARMRGLSDGWLHRTAWSDEQLAAQVERDGVDVLIDLAGLTQYSRLGVMAMRPAPVSLTYLGYPNTTGLASIDWRVVDAVTDPPGSEDQSVERLLRMDGCFVCYKAPEELPAVAGAREGPVTFGSFNNLLKFNDRVARVWGRVLGAVPGARLAIKSTQTGDPARRAEVLKTFEGAGADVARIDLLTPSPGTREHLEAYRAVDIALDTFPYCGTTTTCEALLMGAPVVTLRGDCHRARVGASILSAAGFGGWVAGTEDEYVELAAGLANDRAALAAGRSGLRDRFLNSPVCDGPAWCRRFESVLRRAWVEYCGAGR